MNVLYWTDGFWPRLGGVEVQGIHFIKHMQQLGHRFCVVASQDFASWPSSENYHSMQVNRFDFTNIVIHNRYDELKRIEQWLQTTVSSFQPDIVHLHACIGPAAFVFWMLKKKLKHCPILLTMHGMLVENARIDPMLERIFKSADQVCCVSQALLNEVRQYLPLENGMYVHNGLALPALTPTPLSFSPPTVMMLTRLSSEKGIDTCIKAISQLKKIIPDIKLIIVGEGPEKIAVKQLISELSLQDSIELTGMVATEDVPAMINRASIVVTPSRCEAFGLTALQAMQMQRPVIASKVGGLVEVVLDGETGILIEPDNVNELAEAIQKFIAQPEWAAQCGRAGRARAIEKFSIEKLASRYQDLYSTLSQKQKQAC